jgi:hypothetical protein
MLWNIGWYVGVMAVCGLIGGIISIIVNGKFVRSKKVVSEDGEQDQFVFGSIKEPIAGALGAVLVSLPMYENSTLPIVIQTALIAGFGGSVFLKSYADKALQRELEKSDTLADEGIFSTESEAEGKVLRTNNPLTEPEVQLLKVLHMKAKMADSVTEARFYNKQMEMLVKSKRNRRNTAIL